MIQKSTEFYELYLYDNYVVAEAKENAVIDGRITEAVLNEIFKHYDRKPFTLITHRKNKYTVNPSAYSSRLLRKLNGMAIVSSDPEVKQKALQEQNLFEKPFAFFHELEEAESWALSFVTS